jgi:hypothetical protein
LSVVRRSGVIDCPVGQDRILIEQRGVLLRDHDRISVPIYDRVSDIPAAVRHYGQRFGNRLQIGGAGRRGVEQIGLDPVGVGDLVPVCDSHRFHSLLKHLAGTGCFAGHFDRAHGGGVDGEERAEEKSGDTGGHHCLDQRKP